MKIKNKNIMKWLILSLFMIVTTVTVGVVAWTQQTYKPSEVLDTVVQQTDYIIENDFLIFEPKEENKKVGIILYPGALVEPLAYGYYANELSKEGYTVVICDVPMHLSILGSDKAAEVIPMYPEVQKWYVGGHSMGGVSAAMYASQNVEDIVGLILLGSYPAKTTLLKDLKVLSLYGEKDGLTSIEDIEKSKEQLPDTSKYIEILGGNHAQFGLYGPQQGDNQADIEPLEQQDRMIKETLSFLSE